MKFSRIERLLPSWKSALLAILSAILLILAFPDFEYWFLAWFALVPLLLAIEREKDSTIRSFITGWLFGAVFFFGTCWWLAYAPIHYAGFPPLLAYFLVFCATVGAAVFPGIFGLILSILQRNFGPWSILITPFVWVASEFARYWITGNNWNAIAYSQAFQSYDFRIQTLTVGGIYLLGFELLVINEIAYCLIRVFLFKRERRFSKTLAFYSLAAFIFPIFVFLLFLVNAKTRRLLNSRRRWRKYRLIVAGPFIVSLAFSLFVFLAGSKNKFSDSGFASAGGVAYVVAVQPNVPMSGLNAEVWTKLRDGQVRLAESAFRSNVQKFIDSQTKYSKPESLEEDKKLYREVFANQYQRWPKIVILPESPMNFQWGEDPEFQQFISQFAAKNNVSVLFNSAEPDRENNKYFNSAVMIDASGREVAEYDKIYLLPFGEAVPVPLESFVPGFVGNFSYGKNYNLVPLGDAKAGIMICFESHFGQLSREYVLHGADAIIEMTNDGYLGPTPVLRQHLANAVFRAIETNRPVLRVTNVGITAYINERGEVLDATTPYTEDTRVWTVAKSDGSQTFYVKYGDWFAWVCSAVTIFLLVFSFIRRKPAA